MRRELTSLSVSSLFPYQFVAAGEYPYVGINVLLSCRLPQGDSRVIWQSRIEHNWGAVPWTEVEATTCAR